MHRLRLRHSRLLPWLGALAAMLALAACADRPKAPAGPQAPQGAAAAVYSLLFIDNASSLGPKAAAYCIGNGRGWALLDPDAGTLALFTGQSLVRPASGCDVGKGGEQVLDRASGQPALMFGVELVHCTASGSQCLMRGSYYEGPGKTQSNLYNASQRGGSWQAVMALRGPAP
ncbi:MULTISPECIES: hypothetical protein [Delftia]|uniref:Lipoprotein n=1 Tax=Delftia deserti TaxID=1651218 RepID=A0ABW5EXC5_9BURK